MRDIMPLCHIAVRIYVERTPHIIGGKFLRKIQIDTTTISPLGFQAHPAPPSIFLSSSTSPSLSWTSSISHDRWFWFQYIFSFSAFTDPRPFLHRVTLQSTKNT